MEKSFGESEAFEKRRASDELKTDAWERFLSAYAEDDPYSNRDDEL